MFDIKFSGSECARIAGHERKVLQNFLSKGVLVEPDGGFTLLHAEVAAVLHEIERTFRESVPRSREIAGVLWSGAQYELAPPAGGWGNPRSLHQAWGRARAGEPAWMLVNETPTGGVETACFDGLQAAMDAIESREVGAPFSVRLIPLHKILGAVGRRFHARGDRVERIGAGMFILRSADGSEKLLEEVEELAS